MQGREELAQRYRDEARQRAEQALRLPGGISRNALTPSAVPVIGHAILSTLTRAPSKRTSENSTSLRLLALMGGFGRVAGLTRAGELLMLRQHIKAKGPQVRQDNRKLAIASLIWNSSHLTWLSFLSWWLVQLQRKSVKGILFMSYVEFDESSSNLKVAEWNEELRAHGPSWAGRLKLGRPTQSKGKENVKVFCARLHFSFVVHGTLTGNKYMCISGSLPVPLQGADRSTARATHHVLKQARAVPLLESFADFVLLAVSASQSDRASSNLKYLRALFLFEPRACHLQAFCTVYCTNTSVMNATKVSDADYRGTSHLGLAMRPVGSAADIRRIWAEGIEKRLKVRPDAPPPPDDDPRVVARRRLLHALLPPAESRTNARRFAILDTLVNGGIEDGALEHCGPVTDIRSMCEHIASALLPGPVPQLQMGRWLRNLTPQRDRIALEFLRHRSRGIEDMVGEAFAGYHVHEFHVHCEHRCTCQMYGSQRRFQWPPGRGGQWRGEAGGRRLAQEECKSQDRCSELVRNSPAEADVSSGAGFETCSAFGQPLVACERARFSCVGVAAASAWHTATWPSIPDSPGRFGSGHR